MNSFNIRLMKAADLPSIVRIEEETFTTPFSHSLFAKYLTNPAYRNIVAIDGGKVVGYAIYSIAADESELIDIAVDKGFRGKGIGNRIMEYLMSDAADKGAEKMFLEVRPSNAAALGLYEEHGFMRSGIRKGYYHDTGEDALVYMKELE